MMAFGDNVERAAPKTTDLSLDICVRGDDGCVGLVGGHVGWLSYINALWKNKHTSPLILGSAKLNV